MTPVMRVFSALSVGSIIAFNIILNTIAIEGPENIHRYNLNYLPLYLPFISIIFYANLGYLARFMEEHRRIAQYLAGLVIAIFYVPLFLTMFKHQISLLHRYNTLGSRTSKIITAFIRDSKPAFIYLNRGAHTHFISYPVRVVSEQATHEQFVKVNTILPEPMKFLFLTERDWLYQENREEIEQKKSIFNGQYAYQGSGVLPGKNQDKVMVYMLKEKNAPAGPAD